MKKGFLILASVILLTACSSDTTQKDNQDKSDKEKEQTFECVRERNGRKAVSKG